MSHSGTDPQLTWVALLQAVQENRDADLAEIAISLYGQLGEARAEIDRLRATLQSSLCALASRHADASAPASGQPAEVVSGLDRINAVARVQLGHDGRQVVTHGPDRQVQLRRYLGWLRSLGRPPQNLVLPR